MTAFPEFLYRLTPRDQQVTGLEIISQRLTNNQAAVTLTTNSYTVPLGKLLLLTSVVLQLTPGAAQAGRYGQAYYYPFGATANDKFLFYGVDFNSRTPGNSLTIYGSNTRDVVIPEGAVIQSEGLFTAGAAVNDLQMFITGILIPRGSFAI